MNIIEKKESEEMSRKMPKYQKEQDQGFLKYARQKFEFAKD